MGLPRSRGLPNRVAQRGAPDPERAEPLSAVRLLECEGAPRDLGLDQGRALRSHLRTRFEEQAPWRRVGIRLFGTGAQGAAIRRDLRRHFPQQSETLEGIALGAGVPAAWLAHALGALNGDGRAVALDARVAGVPARVLTNAAPDAVLRRTRPDGGFCALESTEPGLTSATAGVNEAGLAIAAVQRAPSAATGSCAAPALLLVRDCLARFDSVQAAIDWCRRRPAGGRATLVFADRRGGIAGIEIDGSRRIVLDASEGFVATGPGLLDPDARGLLRTGGAPARAAALEWVAPGSAGAIVLDPDGPRLGVVAPGEGAGTAWVDVSAPRSPG